MRKLVIVLCTLLLTGAADAQQKHAQQKHVQQKIAQHKNERNLLDSLLKHDTGIVKYFYSHAKEHRLQIILTIVHRNREGNPIPETHAFRVNHKEYFYPASLVKLPISVLALEKINRIADTVPGLSENSVMITHAAGGCLNLTDSDSSALDYKPHPMHYIRRMMLVSDNASYSRMYELTGYDECNRRMQELCFRNARIVHRFDASCSAAENKMSNPISFLNDAQDTLAFLPLRESKSHYSHPLGRVIVGRYHADARGRRKKGGKNFSRMNFLPLTEADDFLKRLIFPSWYEPALQYKITEEQRLNLIEAMSQYPRESESPFYPQSKFEDSYKKYWLFGSVHDTLDTDSIRICNVVGQSYGFLSDIAYVRDTKNNVEYFLSGCLYVNKNNTMNDGKYEYTGMGFPFFTAFGQSIHRYVISRAVAGSGQ